MFHEALERRIFSQANGFHRIAHESLRLGDDRPRDVSYMIAGIVNSAFASELYLKCLIYLDSDSTVKIHDLNKLYKQLKPSTRAEIERRFDAANTRNQISEDAFYARTGKRLATKFSDIIAAGSHAFTEWRYLYEDSSAALEYGLISLPTLLAEMIMERKPDWRHGVWALKEVIPTPPTSPAR